jgi:hypothetical protein
MNTILFCRNGNGKLEHHEYSPAEMAEIFTVQQRADLAAGKTVIVNHRVGITLFVSGNALAELVV